MGSHSMLNQSDEQRWPRPVRCYSAHPNSPREVPSRCPEKSVRHESADQHPRQENTLAVWETTKPTTVPGLEGRYDQSDGQPSRPFAGGLRIQQLGHL